MAQIRYNYRKPLEKIAKGQPLLLCKADSCFYGPQGVAQLSIHPVTASENPVAESKILTLDMARENQVLDLLEGLLVVVVPQVVEPQ